MKNERMRHPLPGFAFPWRAVTPAVYCFRKMEWQNRMPYSKLEMPCDGDYRPLHK